VRPAGPATGGDGTTGPRGVVATVVARGLGRGWRREGDGGQGGGAHGWLLQTRVRGRGGRSNTCTLTSGRGFVEQVFERGGIAAGPGVVRGAGHALGACGQVFDGLTSWTKTQLRGSDTTPGTPGRPAHAKEPAMPSTDLDGLTPRQRHVLDTIRDAVQTRGYPPSMREIGEAVGLTSPSSVAHQLATLERKGYLRRDPNRPRAIEVVHPDDGAAPDARTERRRPRSGRRGAGSADVPSATTTRPCVPEASMAPSSAASPPAGRCWPSRSSRTCSRSPARSSGTGTLFLLQVVGRLDDRRRDLRRRLGRGAPAAGRRERRDRRRHDRRRGDGQDTTAHATVTSG
jgi:hypothetical protein